VSTFNRDGRAAYLAAGLVMGLCLAYLWPHEPALAGTSDRDERFAMTTCSVGLANSEAVFVLDFLTARLTGAILNSRTGKFTNFYYRDLASDFDIDPAAEPHYAIVSGNVNLPNVGRTQLGQGAIYIGEMTSGKIICYAFPYKIQQQKIPPMQMIPMDVFPFRQALQKE